MTYSVTFTYPNGETKIKCRKIKLLETALKVVEYYERYFGRGGFTKTPAGTQVDTKEIKVDFDEEE